MMRVYDKEFKINAVTLCKSSGRPSKEIAEELGIPYSSLKTWVRQYAQNQQESFPGKGYVKPIDLELTNLRKENACLRQERDILKKALAIFSHPQGKGISS